MWMSFERSLDGMVGRMLSWLTHPPLRSLAEAALETVAETVEAAEEAAERAREAIAEKLDAFVEGAEKEEAAASISALAPDEIDAFVEGAGRAAAEIEVEELAAAAVEDADDELDGEILAMLGKASGSVSVSQLARRTGRSLQDLRPRLRRLEAAGRIRSDKKGINPSYRSREE